MRGKSAWLLAVGVVVKVVYRSPGTLPIDFRPADLEHEILKLVGPDAAAGG